MAVILIDDPAGAHAFLDFVPPLHAPYLVVSTFRSPIANAHGIAGDQRRDDLRIQILARANGDRLVRRIADQIRSAIQPFAFSNASSEGFTTPSPSSSMVSSVGSGVTDGSGKAVAATIGAGETRSGFDLESVSHTPPTIRTSRIAAANRMAIELDFRRTGFLCCDFRSSRVIFCFQRIQKCRIGREFALQRFKSFFHSSHLLVEQRF